MEIPFLIVWLAIPFLVLGIGAFVFFWMCSGAENDDEAADDARETLRIRRLVNKR